MVFDAVIFESMMDELDHRAIFMTFAEIGYHDLTVFFPQFWFLEVW